jgi:hypothetical protein
MRIVLALAGAVLAALVTAAAAQASCLYSTPAQLKARAHVIFDGVALEGPTRNGVQRFRVTKFVKGTGPRVLRVRTGTARRPDGTWVTTSVALFVKRGERWRIFARGSAQRVLQTNYCDGSFKR